MRNSLVGKRCEYGRYCIPNPCRHGGVCEEGDVGPICKCRGFTGELCAVDMNECEASPCINGGTCINEPGTYRYVHMLLPLALQPTVGFGLSNNVLPFSPICHQLSPSSHSQHLKISFYFPFHPFLGLPLLLIPSSS